MKTATAFLAALRTAHEHGGAVATLTEGGCNLAASTRTTGVTADLDDLLERCKSDGSVMEAVALGFLAGRVAHRPRSRTPHDPTAFLMDRELVVNGAEGESILRLPWFEDGMFVGRQLPHISEMPAPVRRLCIDHYTAALDGRRGHFSFTSYGHAYSVDAVPVQGEGGSIQAVLGIAIPGRSRVSVAGAYERTAQRLESSADVADARAGQLELGGRHDVAVAQRRRARRSRDGASRARAQALRLDPLVHDPPSVTSRELEVLNLASHGLPGGEISEQLGISVSTVKTHLQNIYRKLGVPDKAAAVAAALRHGLID
ncbi:MAG: hypothetical protein QOG15_3670 [Solirubrobacteraceae bacterium]|jgi:DNA-binding CsgD family transcriptional regulator|nr:hypothetical protein [Solirubrobacteraceae bacterium]